MLAGAEDFAHLAEALDQVVRKLGGLTLRWRFDRMATVCHPGSGTLTAQFAGLGKYYGVGVYVCPSPARQPQGCGGEDQPFGAQRWWRTLPDDASWAAAQWSVDTLAARMDARRRVRGRQRASVGELAAAEPPRPVLGVPYRAQLAVTGTVTAQALVAFGGSSYSVPPGLRGAPVTVTDLRRRNNTLPGVPPPPPPCMPSALPHNYTRGEMTGLPSQRCSDRSFLFREQSEASSTAMLANAGLGRRPKRSRTLGEPR